MIISPYPILVNIIHPYIISWSKLFLRNLIFREILHAVHIYASPVNHTNLGYTASPSDIDTLPCSDRSTAVQQYSSAAVKQCSSKVVQQ